MRMGTVERLDRVRTVEKDRVGLVRNLPLEDKEIVDWEDTLDRVRGWVGMVRQKGNQR